MWKWMTSWGSFARQGARDDIAVTERPVVAVSGKYMLLLKYLENRYADVIVLTFAQIEDLLGFELPLLAHSSQAWWTLGETNVKGPRDSHAWSWAGRTATANLQARTVTFERSATNRRSLQ